MSNYYILLGITNLFAELDVAAGEVITQCRHRHRHKEFLGSLCQLEMSVPEGFYVHLVVVNNCIHNHAKV